MSHGTLNRRCQGDHGSYISGTLSGCGASNDSAEAVSDEMHLATGIAARLVDGLIETTLNQEVGALGIQSYAGKIRTVADAAKPGMELRQIKISSQKAWNDDDRRTVAVWDSQA